MKTMKSKASERTRLAPRSRTAALYPNVDEHQRLIKMLSDPKKLMKRHEKLVQTDGLKVTSHVQRQEGEWVVNTLVIDKYDVAFHYKRKKQYKNLSGRRVNLTYYPTVKTVAGIEFEVMNVVRLRIS